eukprot:6098091-Karenia_brevis.AAC.1
MDLFMHTASKSVGDVPRHSCPTPSARRSRPTVVRVWQTNEKNQLCPQGYSAYPVAHVPSVPEQASNIVILKLIISHAAHRHHVGFALLEQKH